MRIGTSISCTMVLVISLPLRSLGDESRSRSLREETGSTPASSKPSMNAKS